jgi:hypothetical protein
VLEAVLVVVGCVGELAVGAALVGEVEPVLLLFGTELHQYRSLLLITCTLTLNMLHSEYSIPRITKIARSQQFRVLSINPRQHCSGRANVCSALHSLH